MRSEILRMFRDKDGKVATGSGDPRSNSVLLAELCKEIPLGETKSVRISVEIVGEKGEEKVQGKECVLAKSEGSGQARFLGGIACLFDPVVADWQPGESRKVKSILFATPDGVPVVEFVETPRERLKRALKESENMVFPEQFRHITKECHVYLAATEEAAKKGGG